MQKMKLVKISIIMAAASLCPMAFGAELPEDGENWQNENVYAVNKMPASATVKMYSSRDDALARADSTSMEISLNGSWKFLYAGTDRRAHV